MTDEQKKIAYAVGEEIRKAAGGKDIRIYTSDSIIRLQDIKHNSIYRLYVPHKDDEDMIREEMMRLFAEMRKEKQYTETH